MDLFLHIGTGKTGSTSIQAFLKENADRLAAQGILLPVALGETNHRALPAIVQDGPPTRSFMKMRGITDRAAQDETRKSWLAAFKAEVRDSDAKRCIVTAEHLAGLSGPEVATLQGLLSGMFDSIRVLVYLRDPVDYAVSMFDTAIKVGGTRPEPLSPEPGGETDYKAILSRWINGFGKDALDVRLFDRSQLVQGDIVADFAQAAGIDTTGFSFPKTRNSSLNLLGQALLMRVNRRVPQFTPAGRRNPKRGQIYRVFEQHFATGRKYVPDAAMIAAYRSAFAESNDWVRQTFFPERSELFTPRSYGEPEALALDEAELDQLADLIAALWKQRGAS